jgi:Methyltransferase domain
MLKGVAGKGGSGKLPSRPQSSGERLVSVTTGAQSLLRRLGVNIHPWPSNRHLAFDYPVADAPRYGFKTGPHVEMLRLLDAERPGMREILRQVAARKDLLETIPAKSDAGPMSPFWDNGWFPPLDACVSMHFLLKHRPKRYIEIGSGNSTIFAHHAKRFGGLQTAITSIDPQPRAGIDALCDTVIRTGLEDADLTVFDQLEAGDILFLDGAHVVFQDSDATVFFLEVLPRIKPGVLVHIHDIFWPNDYPESWGKRYYSEQYLLAMLFLYAPEKYHTIFASAYASELFQKEVASLTPGGPVYGVYGTSYWFETH